MRTLLSLLLGIGLGLASGGRPALALDGACCIGDGSCTDTNQSGCDLGSGEFLGEGTTCATTVCLGACCLDQKACAEDSPDGCDAALGDFKGAGTTCALHCAAKLPTAFTYQGQLKQAGVPLSGSADLEFSLWTSVKGGDQVGGRLLKENVPVAGGLLSVPLDFGINVFNGNARWLEIAVRSPHDPGDNGLFTTLNPRQLITATPYALQTRGLFVDDAGNVGIGTNAPSEQLDVVSNIKAGGTIQCGNSIVINGVTDTITAGGGVISFGDENVVTSGVIESTAGGVKFPDATVQTTAFGVNSVGPAEIADGSLTGLDIADEPGVTGNVAVEEVILDGSIQTIASHTINAPTSGFVLAMGTALAGLFHTNGIESNSQWGINSSAGAFRSNHTVSVFFSSSAATGVYAQALTVQTLFPVSAGANTFFFIAAEIDGSFVASNIQLTLVFFPTSYGTVPGAAGAGEADSPAEEVFRISGAKLYDGLCESPELRRGVDAKDAEIASQRMVVEQLRHENLAIRTRLVKLEATLRQTATFPNEGAR